jgi:TonB-dependent receptor
LPATDVWSGLPAKLKLGPAYTRRERDQSLRQFLFDARRSGFYLTLPTETLLAPQNVGPLPSRPGLIFSEVSQPRDSFSASQEIAGLYGLLELPILAGRPSEDGGLVHQLRLIGGVRGEYSYIRVHTVNNSGNPVTTIKNDSDPMPGLNLVYNPRSDTNLRFSYSRTVTRPDFRELSPVQYPAPGALRTKAGNPDLVQVNIDSFDLRWEWFITPAGELASISAFYKKLDNPIEQIVTTEGSNTLDTFVNADNADVIGIELETRANLGRLHDQLRPFSFLTNVTWADSEVTVPQAGPDAVTTSNNRQLQGQAPFVVNAALDFDPMEGRTMRLSYNTVGRRIESAGAFGLPDNYEERRDQLDFVLLAKLNPFDTPNPLTAKFGFENLLNDNYVFTQGEDLQKRYRTGVKFSVGLSYAF